MEGGKGWRKESREGNRPRERKRKRKREKVG